MTYATWDMGGKILHKTYSGSINVGMVDVAEGEVGGKNQYATPKEPAWKWEDEFATS